MKTLTAPLSGGTTYDKKKFGKICLVDADFIKYYVVAAIAKYWVKSGDPETTYGEDYVMKFTQDVIDKMLFERFEAWAFIFCFSGSSKDTYRYRCSLEKEYKGNRKTSDVGYENQYRDAASVINCVSRRNPTYVYYWLEADDLLSALSNEHTMIYSHDKDMMQIPGAHYVISLNKLLMVSEEDALKSLCFQLLTGDTTDNIPGLPGVGPKKAQGILNEVSVHDYSNVILMEYINQFGVVEGTDRFVESWNLLKLRMARGTWFIKCIGSAIRFRDQVISNHQK